MPLPSLALQSTDQASAIKSIEFSLLILDAQPLKHILKILVFEVVIEVCTHMPSAPPVLDIGPQWRRCRSSTLQFQYRLQQTCMPITNKAHIWTCSNNMNLYSFKEPIPTVYVLILNKCKCERNYLVVAIYTDCGEYLTFSPPSQKCAINADNRKTKLKCSNTNTYAKEGSLHNSLSPSQGWYKVCVRKASR